MVETLYMSFTVFSVLLFVYEFEVYVSVNDLKQFPVPV